MDDLRWPELSTPWPRRLPGEAPRTSAEQLVDYPMTMYGLREPKPGPRWQALYDTLWPAYRSWFLSEGDAVRRDLPTSRRMLARHLPELVGTWERLVALTGHDETAARMLTLWDPPRFLPGCSQAVLDGPRPVLVRNYDYSPRLFEQVCYSSEFGDRRVIGTSDCLWGLLDGMNDAGLVVSLAFGGRPGSGPGFGVPLVVRYLLEVADDTDQACQLLARLPVSMAYNLTMTDDRGLTRTAFVAPGGPPDITAAPAATNHHGRTPEYPDHARSLHSEERLSRLSHLVDDGCGRERLAAAFLEPPLHSTAYAQAFGTLYTAIYRPDERSVEYRWPDASWRRTFDSPDETRAVTLHGT
jgi:predicted choloylglycine hydrolase